MKDEKDEHFYIELTLREICKIIKEFKKEAKFSFVSSEASEEISNKYNIDGMSYSSIIIGELETLKKYRLNVNKDLN